MADNPETNRSVFNPFSDIIGGARDESVSNLQQDLNSKVNLPASHIQNGVLVYDASLGAYVEKPGGGIPPGVINGYAAATAPNGWLMCDGAAVSRGLYKDLFNSIGTTYGVGDGSTTFNVPDLVGRFPIGSGTPATPAVTGGTNHALGTKGGEETHAVSVAEMPSHSHGGVTGSSTDTFSGNTGNNSSLPQAGTAGVVANPGGLLIGAQWGTSISAGVTGHTPTSPHTHPFSGTTTGHTHTVSSEGSGTAHNNLPQFTTINYIIKV